MSDAIFSDDSFTVTPEAQDKPLRLCAEVAFTQYLSQIDGRMNNNLYKLVLSEIEQPLLKTVMQFCRGNQSMAARLLGLSRGTLLKKLAQYNID